MSLRLFSKLFRPLINGKIIEKVGRVLMDILVEVASG